MGKIILFLILVVGGIILVYFSAKAKKEQKAKEKKAEISPDELLKFYQDELNNLEKTSISEYTDTSKKMAELQERIAKLKTAKEKLNN